MEEPKEDPELAPPISFAERGILFEQLQKGRMNAINVSTVGQSTLERVEPMVI